MADHEIWLPAKTISQIGSSNIYAWSPLDAPPPSTAFLRAASPPLVSASHHQPGRTGCRSRHSHYKVFTSTEDWLALVRARQQQDDHDPFTIWGRLPSMLALAVVFMKQPHFGFGALISTHTKYFHLALFIYSGNNQGS